MGVRYFYTFFVFFLFLVYLFVWVNFIFLNFFSFICICVCICCFAFGKSPVSRFDVDGCIFSLRLNCQLLKDQFKYTQFLWYFILKMLLLLLSVFHIYIVFTITLLHSFGLVVGFSCTLTFIIWVHFSQNFGYEYAHY